MIVVRMVTTSSTNITGFFIRLRGSSLTKAEPIAGSTILGSNSADTGMRLRIFGVSIGACSGSVRCKQRARDHREVLDDRAERERGEECQSADDDDHAHHQADEQRSEERRVGKECRTEWCDYEQK